MMTPELFMAIAAAAAEKLAPAALEALGRAIQNVQRAPDPELEAQIAERVTRRERSTIELFRIALRSRKGVRK